MSVVLSFLSIHINAVDTDEYQVDENLVVIGSRLETDINLEPVNIDVITEEQIKLSGATSFIEVLRGLGSIQISDNSTNIALSLRGFSSEQAANNTLILVNGRRLNNSDIAAPLLTNISIEDVVRIEILNSSAGVLYGDQAVGGVINIITRTDQQQYTEGSIVVGSFNTLELAIKGQYQLSEKLSLGVSIRDNSTDNYRMHNEKDLLQQQVTVDYQNETMGVSFFVENRELNTNTPGALLESDLISDRGSSRAEFADDFIESESENYQLSSFWNVSDDLKIEADLQHNKDTVNSLTSFINFQSTFETQTRRQQNSFTPRLRLVLDNDYGTTNLTSGVDLLRSSYNFDLLGRSNIQNLTSAYVHASVPISNNVILSGGARYSEVEDNLVDALIYSNGVELNNNATAFNFGLTYTPSKSYRIFVRVEDNFRFAKVDEQSFTSPGVLGLKPQTGVSYDAGISSLLTEGNGWKLSFFHLKLKDEIIFDPMAIAPLGSFFQGANVNSERSVRDGVLFNVSEQFADDLQVSFNASWTDARFSSGFNKSKAIPGVAKITTRVDLNYHLDLDSNATIEYIYKDKRKQDGDASGFFEPLKSYSVVNVAVFHQFKAWQASLRINNLFNKKYNGFVLFNGFYPAAEINAQLRIKYRFDA